MKDLKMADVIRSALSMLSEWYVDWEKYRFHRDDGVRQLALRGKCLGICSHDRLIVKFAEILNG